MSALLGQAGELTRLIGALAWRSLESLRQNLGVGLLALAISAALWVVVSIEQNPPRTDLYPEAIPIRVVNVPPGLHLFGDVPNVRVRITAPADVWDRLVVRDFVATVDLQNATIGIAEYPLLVESRDNRVRVVSVTPPTVPIRLELSRTKVVPVRPAVQGTVPLGFVADAPQLAVREVLVQGPQSLVEQVDFAAVTVEVQDRKVDVNQFYPLTARNEAGYEISGVTLDPPSAQVRITIRQQVFYRTVPVVVVTDGTPAPGFGINAISVDPNTVTLVGNQADLEALSRIETRPISVNGQRSTFAAVAQLALPRGVNLAGEQQVLVRVQIAPIMGQRPFDLVPIIGSQPSGMATLGVDRVRVVLAGQVTTLDQLDAAQLRAIVDLGGLGPGLHRVSARIVAPDNVRVVFVSPDPLMVTIDPPG